MEKIVTLHLSSECEYSIIVLYDKMRVEVYSQIEAQQKVRHHIRFERQDRKTKLIDKIFDYMHRKPRTPMRVFLCHKYLHRRIKLK